jgi:type IV pilus assembly protein PilC
MPTFRYSAVNSAGRRVKDTVSARDPATAVERLRAQGLTVTDIAEALGDPPADGGWAGLRRRIANRDRVLFFRMFAALVASRIPISEAIEILWTQAERRHLKRVLFDVKRRIEGGIPLSQAMAAHPRAFGDLLTSMVAAGELGGILDTVLERICDYLERRAALRARLITSMIYPAVVVVAAVVVVIFLVTFVIPKFAMILGGRTLPASTQFLLDVSAFLTGHAPALTVAAAGCLAAAALLMVIPETRVAIDRYKIYVPLVGPVFRLGVVVQFATTLSSLLESGITLVDALRATNDTVSNLSVRRQVERVNDRVLAGEPLSAALAGDRFFPPMVMAMVQVGEHSGLMDQAWATVGRIYEKILEDRIARLSAMVEPALIIVLGGIVGYVAWGLIAGMLAMYASH